MLEEVESQHESETSSVSQVGENPPHLQEGANSTQTYYVEEEESQHESDGKDKQKHTMKDVRTIS